MTKQSPAPGALRVAVVTGGSGFIGSHLVTSLIEAGTEVIVIDRNTPTVAGVSRFIRGEIQDPTVWRTLLLERSDVPGALFHLAARTSVLQSIQDPHDVFLSNIVGFEQALEYCRKAGVPHVTFASTNAVVGDAFEGTISESLPLGPLTPYGATKAAGEMLAYAYSAAYGLSVSSVRLTNVYGPVMWKKDSIVPRLFRHALGLNDMMIYGDGSQFRDFVYVSDVVNAFLELTRQRYSGPVSFGSGVSVSVNQLIEKVREISGVDRLPRHGAPQKGEMRGVNVSLDLAASLGLSAEVPLEVGLERAWADFLSSQEAVAG